MPNLSYPNQMEPTRRILGLGIGAIGVVAAGLGGRDLVLDLKAASTQHSMSLALLGLIGPAILFGVATLSLRVAYRNVFWRRLVATVRGPAPSISTAPPNER
jgi:hypothetical protein